MDINATKRLNNIYLMQITAVSISVLLNLVLRMFFYI